MCSKVAYSYRKAHELIADLHRNGHGNRRHNRCRKDDIPRRAYYCDECQAWHLTHLACPVAMQR